MSCRCSVAGVMYMSIFPSPNTKVRVRAGHIYDASQYWYNVSSGERHGLGIMKLGRDYLLPSCDYEKDICSYSIGGTYFRDSDCPKLTVSANGVMNENGKLAVFNHNNKGDYLNPPLGKYIATTARYTDKVRGRDYNTYDSQLHREAGVNGIVNSDTAWTGWYESTPHGSLFYFDMPNSLSPCWCSLIAVKNLFVTDIIIRAGSLDPRENEFWSDFPFRASVASNSSGPTFYVTTGTSWPLLKVIRNMYAPVSINGETYELYMVSLDWPRTGQAQNFTYVESPWYKVQPTEGEAGSLYILDEWVTIHKPGS